MATRLATVSASREDKTPTSPRRIRDVDIIDAGKEESEILLDLSSVTSSELEDICRRLTVDGEDASEAVEELSRRCRQLEDVLTSREARIAALETRLVEQWQGCRESHDAAAAEAVLLEASRRELDDTKRAAARAALDLAESRRVAEVARSTLASAEVEHAKLQERVNGLAARTKESSRHDSRPQRLAHANDVLRARCAKAKMERQAAQTQAAVHAQVAKLAIADANAVVAAAKAAVASLKDSLWSEEADLTTDFNS